MSDPRPARPPAPPTQQSPRAPRVGIAGARPAAGNPPPVPATKPAPQAQIRTELEPPPGGWDEADTVTSLDEPVMSSNPAAVRANNAPPARPSPSTREEIWIIVRAAVEEAVIPLVQRMRDLEVRLERAESAAREKPKLASIPVSLGPPPLVPMEEATSTLPNAGAPKATPSPAVVTPVGTLRMAPPPAVIAASPSPSQVDLAALARMDVGEMEGFDGGKRKKLLGKIVVGLLLAGVLLAIVLTIVSRS